MAANYRGFKSALFLGVVFSSSMLAGCLGGGGGGGGSSAAASTPGAPVITGSAPTAVKPNARYSFTPTATDPDGDLVSFEIQNKPEWATFNTVTGELTGTPTQKGKYDGIVISASDGKGRSQLKFSIMVDDSAAGGGPTATLAWTAPTENVDGTPLTDLSGYVISYGTSSDALTESVTVDNPSVDRWVFDQLPPGTYYFAVRAISASGAESDPSQQVSKAIG